MTSGLSLLADSVQLRKSLPRGMSPDRLITNGHMTYWIINYIFLIVTFPDYIVIFTSNFDELIKPPYVKYTLLILELLGVKLYLSGRKVSLILLVIGCCNMMEHLVSLL